MKIIPARKEDAKHIAEALIMAITPQLCKDNFGQSGHTVEDIQNVFESLAMREDSQYSYLNSLVAIDDDGKVMGATIAYDGARLHELRDIFFKIAHEALKIDFPDEVADETSPDEFYLDTIAVFPEYRGRGIAAKLLAATNERTKASGKPLGLLVDKENDRARRVYEKAGFQRVGDRFFFNEMMDHMQIPI